MVSILSVSVTTLLIISIYQHWGEIMEWWKSRSQRAEENTSRETEYMRRNVEEQPASTAKRGERPAIQYGQSQTSYTVSSQTYARETRESADTKAANLAKQISSLIESADLNEEQTANLVDYLVSKYVPASTAKRGEPVESKLEGNGVTK